MLRPKVWGPITLVSGCAMGWQALDLIADRPDLRPWVVFLLFLAFAAMSGAFYLVSCRMEQLTRLRDKADKAAFDRSTPRIRRIDS